MNVPFSMPLDLERGMNRDQLIRALRKHARKNGLPKPSVMKKKGKGSHYIVEIGNARTTMQSDLDTFEAERCLKQLGIDPTSL